MRVSGNRNQSSDMRSDNAADHDVHAHQHRFGGEPRRFERSSQIEGGASGGKDVVRPNLSGISYGKKIMAPA
jgi:hypothetical protein